MVLELASESISVFLLAHGADPTPLAWDEALANLVKFFVTFLVIGFMSYPVLAPLLKEGDTNQEEGPGQSDQGPPSKKNFSTNESAGWVAIGLVLVFALGWWLTRTSLVEVMTEEKNEKEEHAHTQTEGGQVAMWGDFHAEVVRVESGEVRIYLTDSYNRDIAARFFEAEIEPLERVDGGSKSPEPKATAVPRTEMSDIKNQPRFLQTKASLNDAYRFARVERSYNLYRIKVSTPGWTASLKFDFDGSKGRRSLPIWCASP